MITAVITHYYPERTKYLRMIIDALKSGSLPPDEIIIWNNIAELDLKYPDAICINSSHNFGTFSKQYACLFAKNKYVLMQDNDLMVGKDTVKNLYEFARKHPHCFVGKWGRNVGDTDKPYTDSELARDGKVDIVVGCLNMCAKEVIIRSLQEKNKHEKDLSRVEDIITSYANRKHGNYALDVEAIQFDEEGIGLCHIPGHYGERDEMVNYLWKNK